MVSIMYFYSNMKIFKIVIKTHNKIKWKYCNRFLFHFFGLKPNHVNSLQNITGSFLTANRRIIAMVSIAENKTVNGHLRILHKNLIQGLWFETSLLSFRMTSYNDFNCVDSTRHELLIAIDILKEYTRTQNHTIRQKEIKMQPIEMVFWKFWKSVQMICVMSWAEISLERSAELILNGQSRHR